MISNLSLIPRKGRKAKEVKFSGLGSKETGVEKRDDDIRSVGPT